MTREPDWVTVDDALLFHDVVLRRYGGLAGVRDIGLLESALGRPRHVYHYETQDLFVLAATYADGIANNHPFVDGNKRTALVCTVAFLELNGVPFEADQAEEVVMVEGLACGKVDRDMFADWLRKMA